MKNDKDCLKISFTKRRVLLIKCSYILLTIILIAKLIKLQVIDSFLYKKRSNNNAIREIFLIPQRGIIYDRNMIEIANTTTSNKLVYYSGKNKNDISNIDKIYNILGRKSKDIDNVHNSIKKYIRSHEKIERKNVLARNLTSDEYMKLKFNSVFFNEMEIEDYSMRNYKYGSTTSALIGYVSGVRNTANKIAKVNLEYRVGASGIEKILDNKLQGKIGIQYNIINSTGKKIDEIEIKSPINGSNVVSSIDQRLQNKLSEIMQNKNGASTLIDVQTGAILAMCSSPNIDPNHMSIGISNDEWNDMYANSDTSSGIFLNKNISAVYPPGSTFKIVTALAALENGWDPERKVDCKYAYKIGNSILHCWEKHGHGSINMNVAIAQSCNYYFFNLSTQVSCNKIHDMALRLGLGQKHMENFDSELSGFIPSEKWKRRKYDQNWYSGDNANFAIGQGWTIVTPLQLAVMISRVATNKVVIPRYLLKNENADFPSLGINEEHLSAVRQGLFSAVNAPYGIVRRIVDSKYQICGKTGSAQIISQRIENSAMRSGKVAKEKHSHGLFVGYAPFDNPRFAVSVVIEHGIGGSSSAAPVGIKILADAIDIYKILD